MDLIDQARDAAARAEGWARPRSRRGAVVATSAALLASGVGLGYLLKRRFAPEEAAYALIEQDGAFSLRRYAPQLRASTRAEGPMRASLDRGFRRLFGYIAAKPGGRAAGAPDAAIAMTVPVLSERSAGDASGWTTRFVMPSGSTRASLPAPGAGITLDEVPRRLVAAIRFAGSWSDQALLDRKRAELLAWLAKRGLAALAAPEFAAYNAPIVPPPLRRNEWLAVIAE